MNLSRSYTLEEFTISETGARHGVANNPPQDAIQQLERLCRLVLQPLRDDLKQFVVITSGYRSPKVNRLVGGAYNSFHLEGRAADIRVPGMTPLAVCLRIKALRLPYDELIHEYASWCHVAVAAREDTPARKELTAIKVNGFTQYQPGLA